MGRVQDIDSDVRRQNIRRLDIARTDVIKIRGLLIFYLLRVETRQIYLIYLTSVPNERHGQLIYEPKRIPARPSRMRSTFHESA